MHPIFRTSAYNISQDSNYTRQLSTKLEFRNIKLSNLLKNKNSEGKKIIASCIFANKNKLSLMKQPSGTILYQRMFKLHELSHRKTIQKNKNKFKKTKTQKKKIIASSYIFSNKTKLPLMKQSLGVTHPKPKFKFHELSHRNPQKTIQKHKKRKQDIEITQKDDCESRRASKSKSTTHGGLLNRGFGSPTVRGLSYFFLLLVGFL